MKVVRLFSQKRFKKQEINKNAKKSEFDVFD